MRATSICASASSTRFSAKSAAANWRASSARSSLLTASCSRFASLSSRIAASKSPLSLKSLARASRCWSVN